MITGTFHYSTNPILLIGGDYYCRFLIGDDIRGQTTPIPLPFPVPLHYAEQILSFFDTSVTDGTLTGEGPGKSADGRLKARRNMIESARDLIAAGKLGEAYQQLVDAYKKTDGDSHIPDFVSGEAAAELAQMILDLENSLMQPASFALATSYGSTASHTPVPSTLLLLGSGLLDLAGWRRFRKS
jgi:hypothetical protein